MLVMLFITVFSIQPFSTTAMTANNNQPNSTVSSFQQVNTKPQSVQTLNKVDSTVPTSNLRNLSMSDLLTYLKASFTYKQGYFVDSSYDYLDTTITAAKALTTLKILGLTGYVVPLDNNKTKIYTNFGNVQTNGGFPVKSGLNETSIMGTFGAVETIQLLNLAVQYIQINNKTTSYLLSNYYLDQGLGGFKESYQTNLSVQSTYYAVRALNILGYQFSQAQVANITSFLQSLWNTNGYFSNTNDVDQSTILTSFQAISVLNILNQSHTVDQTFFNLIKTNFPQFIASHQNQDGVFAGGIHSTSTQPTVDDTGSALSALYILNDLNQINVTGAVQFILQSQYLNGQFGKDIGGFAPNNSTESSTAQYSDVTLSHTYYAILGLYSSGYLTNNTAFSFETQFSIDNSINTFKNEMVIGQNTTLNTHINTLDFKNAFGPYNISLQANNLGVSYESTLNNDSTTGSVYTFQITNTSTASYVPGAHSVQVQYSLINFTVVPVRVLNFTGSIVVRLPLTNTLNSVSTALTVNPDNILNGEIHLDTLTLNQSGITYNTLGNVSVTIIYPDETSVLINSSNDFPLSLSSTNYIYSYHVAKNAILGDYMVKLSYFNGTSGTAIFNTTQIFTVTSTIHLLNIQSLNSKNEIYPGSNFYLNFTLTYDNGQMNNVTSVQARFLESTGHLEKFDVNLQHVSGTLFTANSSATVPVGLFVGSYNVSLTLTWNSTTTGNQLIKTATNATLPSVSYQAVPIIEHQNIAPASGRTDGNILYSGDKVNLTATISIKNKLTSQLFDLNETVDLTAVIVNTKDLAVTYQTLSTNSSANGVTEITASGEINPNINLLNDVNVTLLLKVKMDSTGVFSYLSTNVNNKTQFYIPTLLLKKANLQLDSNSVDFIIGASTINLNTYTTLLATFKVFSTTDSIQQYVSGLNLNGTLVKPSTNGQNDTVIPLPAVTSLTENSSYQIQIPVNSLDVGDYVINIAASNTNVHLGNFSLTINPPIENNTIPIENFIALGAVAVSVGITLIANSIRKRKN